MSESSTNGLPLLILHDPEGAGNTSLDPLSLTPIGEQLAVDMIPGVRERQTHPRYLTAIAASHAVCQDLAPDTLASDGVSEPWQVFEWYMVEGLVRSAGTESEAQVPSLSFTAPVDGRIPLFTVRQEVTCRNPQGESYTEPAITVYQTAGTKLTLAGARQYLTRRLQAIEHLATEEILADNGIFRL
ncbi:MAG: hypothetical protein HS122_13115 [Opitutaceae bacterium]|nr:hypothetical protein [Opitutaceae bacterium]